MGKKSFLLAIFLLIIIMPLASADVVLHLQKSATQSAQPGNILEIPADLTNNGPCAVDCFYKYPEFPQGIDNKIGSGIQGRQDFIIQLKAPSTLPSKLEIKAVCKEQNIPGCSGMTYESITYFEFLTSQSSSSSYSTSNSNSCWCDNNKICEKDKGECPECGDCNVENQIATQPSGFNSDNVGQFIGIVFVIIISAALFVLIIFGFYRMIKKLFFHEGKKGKGEENGKRRLSAIMFTDMKGYSREMGQDEEATLKKMWRYEKAMKEIIKEHDGRIVKTIGDSIMGDFDSPVNAVRSAMAIQSLLKKEDIQIRVGIHLGDVVHRAGDVFGDGVNIASRIESICEPGKIYISEDVYNQVKGKIKADFENLGNRPLKNIESPPRVYKIN